MEVILRKKVQKRPACIDMGLRTDQIPDSRFLLSHAIALASAVGELSNVRQV